VDIALFRFINTKLANPFFDTLMPFVSGNPLFFPALLVAALVLIWKGRTRGILCVAMLALILPLGDRFVCRTIKKAVKRPRPFVVLADVHRPGSRNQYSHKSIVELISTNATDNSLPDPSLPSKSPTDPRTAPIAQQPEFGSPTRPWPPGVPIGSMPSSHAANWFAAVIVAYTYYRRSLWIVLPVALLVSFSRIYNGVHYPSDVLVGAILGAGYAAAGLWTLEHIWRWAGQKCFPVWWRRMPSLIQCRNPDADLNTIGH